MTTFENCVGNSYLWAILNNNHDCSWLFVISLKEDTA